MRYWDFLSFFIYWDVKSKLIGDKLTIGSYFFINIFLQFSKKFEYLFFLIVLSQRSVAEGEKNLLEAGKKIQQDYNSWSSENLVIN